MRKSDFYDRGVIVQEQENSKMPLRITHDVIHVTICYANRHHLCFQYAGEIFLLRGFLESSELLQLRVMKVFRLTNLLVCRDTSRSSESSWFYFIINNYYIIQISL